MNKVFDDKVKPLLDVIENVCKEEGINFLAQFQLEGNEIYHAATRDMLLDGDTILSQYDKFCIRHGIK